MIQAIKLELKNDFGDIIFAPVSKAKMVGNVTVYDISKEGDVVFDMKKHLSDGAVVRVTRVTVDKQAKATVEALLNENTPTTYDAKLIKVHRELVQETTVKAEVKVEKEIVPKEKKVKEPKEKKVKEPKEKKVKEPKEPKEPKEKKVKEPVIIGEKRTSNSLIAAKEILEANNGVMKRSAFNKEFRKAGFKALLNGFFPYWASDIVYDKESHTLSLKKNAEN
jgi:hypothetical protein